jgi:hypothetical protein
MPRKKSGVPKQKPPKLLTVALHLPADPKDLNTHCMVSWAAIKKDTAHFPAPSPPGPEVDADLAALALALTAAEGGNAAATAELKVAADKVKQDFHQLGRYVQGALRSGAIEDAPAILANILMYPSNVGQRKPKAPFAVVQPLGVASGSVHAIALAVLSALTYGWESSLDQQTWTVTTTGQARATLTGLTPGKTYYFRFRAFRRNGTLTDYSQVVSLLVR